MCGIVAYLGGGDATSVLISGLERLEYRGYDSAGIAVIPSVPTGRLTICKKKGEVNNLKEDVEFNPIVGHVGIGHTRWATHGPPSDVNAHPHMSGDGKLAVVHNGIIENEQALRTELINKGYHFKSQTDTEVLVHLVDDVMKTTNTNLAKAVPLALRNVVGAYGVVFVHNDEPDLVVGAKMGSPLIVAVGEDEYFIGSDATPFVEYTKKVVYLKDGEWVRLHRTEGFEIASLSTGAAVVPELKDLEVSLESIEKGGYDYFMLKEIMEQPTSIANCLRGRINSDSATVKLGGMDTLYKDKTIKQHFLAATRVIIVACGTSYHAGLVGRYMIEDLARVPVQVEHASEFRYRNPVLEAGCVLVAISQSGETADTLESVKYAQGKGVLCFGIVNAVGSSIARQTDSGIYIHAGPEIGVASTKAFTGQATVLAMLALVLAKDRTMTSDQLQAHLNALQSIPNIIEQMLPGLCEQVAQISQNFRYAQNFLYMGRGVNHAVALEGALKLKEISYIHAAGHHSSETRHSIMALVEDCLPAVFIAIRDSTERHEFEKTVADIREYVNRGGVAMAVTDTPTEELSSVCDFVVRIPAIGPEHSFLLPLLTVVPLQLLSYYVAVLRKCNVDKPRNLAKSVTVE